MKLTLIPLWKQAHSPEEEDFWMWSESEVSKLKFSAEDETKLRDVCERLTQRFSFETELLPPVDFHAMREPRSRVEALKRFLKGEYSIGGILRPFYKLGYVLKWIEKNITYDSDLMVFVTNFPVGKECGFPLVEPRILTGHMIDRRRVLISGYHLISSNEIYKEILHEIGHCWGLDHYQKRHSSMWCVMNANIPLDLRDDWYCEKCESKLRQIGVLAHE